MERCPVVKAYGKVKVDTPEPHSPTRSTSRAPTSCTRKPRMQSFNGDTSIQYGDCQSRYQHDSPVGFRVLVPPFSPLRKRFPQCGSFSRPSCCAWRDWVRISTKRCIRVYLCVLAAVCLFPAACAGNGGGGSGGGTPAGTYTISIIGRAGSAQYVTTVKLTVQ
jgi:hypothetical protein